MKNLFAILLLTALLFPLAQAEPKGASPVEITVYRSPSCGCCGKWLEHMRRNGFTVKDIQTEDMQAVKLRHGVPDALQSCHTALVGGYVIEGHVPAADVRALLEQKLPIAGLSVPGMPVGTPGMEMGGRQEPYAVVQFDKAGKVSVFHDYQAR